MNKLKIFFSVIIISVAVCLPNRAHAQIPPKAKAYLVICAYGTVGGALLGFASLAFQNNSRAIAQGASLGLYAGMIFGGYVLATHKKKGAATDEYQDPYQQQQPPPPGFGPEGGDPSMAPPGGGLYPDDQQSESGGGFFGMGNRIDEINEKYAYSFRSEMGSNSSPPIYMNLLNIQF